MFNARGNITRDGASTTSSFPTASRNKIIDARIDDTDLGSDHCPVVLEIDL